MSKLCLLETTSTPCFSCHFFPTDQGRFCFVLHFYSCNLWQTRRCAADRISLCHFEQAALVSKAILASLTFKGVPVSEMNGLTRKCADNKERNGYVWQNTDTRPKQYKSTGVKKKIKIKTTMNALSGTDECLSKWTWSLMEKKPKENGKMHWNERKGGDHFCAQFQKNKVCVGGEKKRKKKKERNGPK